MNLITLLAAGLAAGIVASPHCLLMCAPLERLQLRDAGVAGWLQLHGGRIAGYALLGALAGGLGLALLRQLPSASYALALQLAAAGVLVVLGVRRWRAPPACCRGGCYAKRRTRPHFAYGLTRALLPCAMLYPMLLLAAASQNPLEGGLSLAAFGIGTAPTLLGGGLLLQRLGVVTGDAPRVGGALLIGAGLLTMAATLLHGPFVAAWCLPPS